MVKRGFCVVPKQSFLSPLNISKTSSYFLSKMMRRVLSPRINVNVVHREFSIMDKAGGMFGGMGNM